MQALPVRALVLAQRLVLTQVQALLQVQVKEQVHVLLPLGHRMADALPVG